MSSFVSKNDGVPAGPETTFAIARAKQQGEDRLAFVAWKLPEKSIEKVLSLSTKEV